MALGKPGGEVIREGEAAMGCWTRSPHLDPFATAWEPSDAADLEGLTLVRAGLALEPAVVAELRTLLSPDEIERAATYGGAAPRRRFIVRRALLRRLLAEKLGCPAQAIAFEYGALGKPAVAGAPVEISVASSCDEAVFLLSRRGGVGVDIERVDPRFSFESLLGEHFTSAERVALEGLPLGLRRARFFRSWTCKEACAKALGVGLGAPLADYEVLSESDVWMRVACGLAVRSVETGDGFAVALAVEGSCRQTNPRRLAGP